MGKLVFCFLASVGIKNLVYALFTMNTNRKRVTCPILCPVGSWLF